MKDRILPLISLIVLFAGIFLSNYVNASVVLNASDVIGFNVSGEEIAKVTSSGVFPSSTNSYDLGSSSLKWANIYAVNVHADNININGGSAVTGSGSAGQVAFWTDSSTISGDNNLYWDNSNKRLGIGTSNPQAKLDVAREDNTIELGCSGSNCWTNANGIIGFRGYGANHGQIAYYPSVGAGGSFALIESSAGDPAGDYGPLSFDRDFCDIWANQGIFKGNVGIGTTSPGAKLEVAGNARSNRWEDRQNTGGYIDLWIDPVNGGYINFPNNAWGGGGDDAYIRYYNDSSGENTRLLFYIGNDGNDDLYLEQYNLGNPAIIQLEYGDIKLYADGSERMRIDGSQINAWRNIRMNGYSILDANNVETHTIYDPEDAYLSIADNVYFTVNGTRLYLKSKSGQTYTGIYTTSTSNRLFVRSENTDDVAEFASYGLYLPKDPGIALYVGGDIRLGYASGSDDDTIYFDAGDKYIRWVEGNDWFNINNDLYVSNGWVRVAGQRGLYFQDYGGGWYMTDSTWIRAYNNKPVYSGGEIRSGSNMRAPVFYDLNDGSYYVDPNSWSYLKNIQIKSSSTPHYQWKNLGDDDVFGVGMWNSTTDRLEWYYYNGSKYKWAAMTFCVNHDLSNPRLTIGGYCTGNSRNLYVYGTGEFTGKVYVPILYDRDNTGYYVNPAGASNLNTIQLNDENTKILEGNNNAVRIQTNSGYVDIGPQNTGYTHFSTDRPAFWFNKQVQVNGGVIAAYNSHMYLQAPQGTTRIFVNKDNGNVGIGTTSPGAKLDVNGNVYIRGNNFRITSDGTGDTYLDIYGKDGGSWDAQLRFFNYTGSLIHLFHTGDRDRLVLVTGYDGNAEKAFEVQGNLYVTSGNVGIGTTSPSEKLDIAGNSEINGYLYLNKGSNSDMKIDFQNDAWGGGGDDAWIKYYSESGENTKLQIGISNDANDDLELYQYGNWRLRLESGNILMNGNVGIGTTSFSSGVKVEIAGGDLDLNGNKIQRVTGIDTDTSMNIWMGGGTLDAEGGKIIGVNEIQASVFKDRDNTGYYLDPASIGDSVHVAGTIRMGLGTPGGAVPTLNLYAKGYNSTNVEVQDRATWYMNVNATWVDKRTLSLWYYPGDKIGGCCHHLASFGVKSDGSNYVYLAPKVGIGTSSPSYTLDVAGDIHANGDVYASTLRGNLECTGCVGSAEIANGAIKAIDLSNPLGGSINASAYYDSDNSARYLDPSGTSKVGEIYIYGATHLNNNNIDGVNQLYINDPGDQEGILWSGTQAKIFVSPLDGGNSDGYLRIVNDGGISLETPEDTEVLLINSAGNVGIGTTSPSQKLDVSGGNIEINNGNYDGTYNIKGLRLYYTGDDTEVSTGSTSWTTVKQTRIYLDSDHGIKPRYITFIASIWNSDSSGTTHIKVCVGSTCSSDKQVTGTTETFVEDYVDISSLAEGVYDLNIDIKADSGTAYQRYIDIYYVF